MDTAKVRIISIIAAVITVFCVGYYLQRVEESKPITTTVVEAASNIPEGTLITADMLLNATIYQTDMIPQAITDSTEVVGQYAGSRIVAGSQIASSMLSDQRASSSASSFSYKIPDGMRTVTISISQTTSVAGMLQVGDHVDILATYAEQDGESSRTITKYIAQNIEIAALDQTVVRSDETSGDTSGNSSSGSASATTVTMFVTPSLAQALVWESQNGNIVLTLRSPDDTGEPPAETFSADDMKNLSIDSSQNSADNRTETDAMSSDATADSSDTVESTDSTVADTAAVETQTEAAHD